MSTVKRTLVNVSFYDPEAIQRKLEQMAAQGWMIQKAGNLFWTYTKIPPQKLRFAVTYFPGASEFDPKPSEKQLEKEELCAQDGWRLVLRWDVMQIFCTDREDAVPIDTDPVPQVGNIHRTMQKKVLAGQLVMALLIFWFLYLQLSQLWRDPEDYLSDNSRLFTIPLWLMLLLMTVWELIFYFRWERRAKEAAEHGVFLPVRAHPWLSWAAVGLATVFLLLSFAASSSHLLFLLSAAVVTAVPTLLARWMLGALKRRGVSRWVNLAVTCAAIFVLVIAGTGVIVAASLRGWLPLGEESQPVGQYDWDGLTMDIYDDPLPLEVEELVQVDARWSKEARLQESPLLAYGDYRQDLLYGQEVRGYELRYEITDVKVPLLYDFVKDGLIRNHQDEALGEYLMPVDSAPWNAQEAYQLHWDGGLLDTYLVCWEKRIVEIKFYWTPTQEQIQIAAERLGPAS